MIIYFDLQPEYRKMLAELLGSKVADLSSFYEDLESELAWHLALGGLRESDLSDEEILGQMKKINQAVAVLDEALEEMSPDLFGWLVDYAPVGLDYQMPFRVIRKPAKVIESMTEKAIQDFKSRSFTAKRSSSADFIRKIAYCCEKNFGSRPDLESELFHNLVDVVFQSLAINELKDIEGLIKEAMKPPVVILDGADEPLAEQNIPVPKNYPAAEGEK